MAEVASKIFSVFKRLWPGFAVGIVFMVLCFIGINAAMEQVSSSQYCGSKCHEMNTAYQSWELSEHGANKYGIQVGCVDCHLPPRQKYFTHLSAKIYKGGKDLYKHHFGAEYDIEKTRKKVIDHASNEMCTRCHNSLLVKPSNAAARIAHAASLSEPDEPEYRCVSCHEEAGHRRNSESFSP